MTGSPTPEVEWTKVGGSLSPQAVVEDGKLKLLNVTKQDEGEYECTAKNTVGCAYNKTKLEVIQGSVQPPEVLVVTEGNDTSVGCQATVNIQPHMKWSKSGGDLPAGRALILADGTLKLTNIQLEDAGEYVCTASVGEFEFTVGKMQLIVSDGKPMIYDFLYRSLNTFYIRRRFPVTSEVENLQSVNERYLRDNRGDLVAAEIARVNGRRHYRGDYRSDSRVQLQVRVPSLSTSLSPDIKSRVRVCHVITDVITSQHSSLLNEQLLFITKCDSSVITKCDKRYYKVGFYYKVWRYTRGLQIVVRYWPISPFLQLAHGLDNITAG